MTEGGGLAVEAVAAMLLGGLGILAGTVTYLFKLLLDVHQRRTADLQERLDEKDKEIARLQQRLNGVPRKEQAP